MTTKTLSRLIFGLIALTCCTALADTITSTTGNFRVQSPPGWSINRNLTKEAIFVHPEVHGGFRCNMVFIEEPMNGFRDLESAVDSGLQYLRKLAPDARVTSRTNLTTNSGATICKVTYTASLFAGKPPVTNTAYFMIVGGGNLLTVTVSAVNSTPSAALSEAEDSVLTLVKLGR